MRERISTASTTTTGLFIGPSRSRNGSGSMSADELEPRPPIRIQRFVGTLPSGHPPPPELLLRAAQRLGFGSRGPLVEPLVVELAHERVRGCGVDLPEADEYAASSPREECALETQRTLGLLDVSKSGLTRAQHDKIRVELQGVHHIGNGQQSIARPIGSEHDE